MTKVSYQEQMRCRTLHDFDIFHSPVSRFSHELKPSFTPILPGKLDKEVRGRGVPSPIIPNDSGLLNSSTSSFFPDKSQTYSLILDYARSTHDFFTHDDLHLYLIGFDASVANLRDYTKTLCKKGYLRRLKSGVFMKGDLLEVLEL